MRISCIVAAGKNNVIGKDNDIPWHLPADLQYFKKTTLNHHIIMGRNCFESIGRPLPKRTNIVLTRDPFYIASNCLIAHSITEALAIAKENGAEEAFIIGGGKIYEQSQELWDKLYFTDVDIDTEGDVFFPEIDLEQWNLIQEDIHHPDEKNKYAYNFKIFERKM
jgi:dihydrofolate reductase